MKNRDRGGKRKYNWAGGRWLRKEYSEMCSAHYPQAIKYLLWVDFLWKQPTERIEFQIDNVLWQWCVGTPALWQGGGALIFRVCRFLWYKHSHHSWCQAINILTTGLQNSQLFNKQLSWAQKVSNLAHHFMRHPVIKTDPKRQQARIIHLSSRKPGEGLWFLWAIALVADFK